MNIPRDFDPTQQLADRTQQLGDRTQQLGDPTQHMAPPTMAADRCHAAGPTDGVV